MLQYYIKNNKILFYNCIHINVSILFVLTCDYVFLAEQKQMPSLIKILSTFLKPARFLFVAYLIELVCSFCFRIRVFCYNRKCVWFIFVSQILAISGHSHIWDYFFLFCYFNAIQYLYLRSRGLNLIKIGGNVWFNFPNVLWNIRSHSSQA